MWQWEAPGIVDFGNMSSGSFDWTGRAKDFMPSVAPFAVDPNFKEPDAA